jgi:hypothetical protein
MKHLFFPVTLALLSSAAAVHAEPAAEERPSLDSPAEPDFNDEDTPAWHRKGRVHDGFFLRMGIGPGHVSDKIEGAGPLEDQEFTIRGAGPGIELMLGGTVAPGLVVGGGLWGTTLSSAELDDGTGGEEFPGTVELNFSQLGPFVDYYPNPRGGLHLLLGGGLGTFSMQKVENEELLANAKGFAGLAGVGYEFWVGKEWSLGATAKLSYARLAVGAERHSLLSPSLLFGATFH